MKFRTKLLRAGSSDNDPFGSIPTPIYQTATYRKLDPDGEQEHEYAREGTPTSRALEERLAELEEGTGCVSFGSGMAGILAVMLNLEAGDHIIAGEKLYGGTRRLFDEVLTNFDLSFSYVDLTEPENLNGVFRPETTMLFLETPTNPTLRMVDIEAVSNRAPDDVTVVADNTFLTPYFQQPLRHGADIVVQSLTKYLAGHHDLIGGAVVPSDEEWLEDLRFQLKTIGPTLAPTESFLTLRGLKSLSSRMEQHRENAERVAMFLAEHPAVEQVIYPGSDDHPDADVAQKQMSGGGGMLAAEVAGGAETAHAVVRNTDLWIFADSLGGCDALISHPATQSHEDVPEPERKKQGVTGGLLRLSPGLEDSDDLVQDLRQALDAASGSV